MRPAVVRPPRVPIFTYHRLSGGRTSGPDPPTDDSHYTVVAEAFASQMRTLSERGFSPIPLEALLPGGPPITVAKPVVITFDDGYVTDLPVARTILDRLGWRSEHFVTTNWIGSPGFMTWQHLKELAAGGHGVHSHSTSHAYLDTLSALDISVELSASKSRLQDGLGRAVDFFAVPGGHGASRRVRTLARAAGYRGMCTSVVGRNVPFLQPYALRRISVTRGMAAEAVARLAEGIGLGRLALLRTSFRAVRRVLGPGRYDILRASLLREEPQLVGRALLGSPLPVDRSRGD